MSNLLDEFWCLAFQILPDFVLQRARPDNVTIIQPGIHLNRASPLRQVYNFQSEDENESEKAAELAERAHELLESSDPEVAASSTAGNI